jgi:hypothetical protein
MESLLCRSSKPAAVVLLLVLDLRSAAPKPFHPDAGGEHPDGQQRDQLAPADGTAHLNCTAEDFRSSQIAFLRAARANPARSIVRRRDQRQQMSVIIVANRKKPVSAVAAVRGSYRSASKMKAIRRTNPAVTIPNTAPRRAK